MKVPIYVDEGHDEIIGEVSYNNNLDHWDGSNHTCGSPGHHKGLAIWDDHYVVIHGSQWQGSQDYALVVSPKEAVQEILKSGNTELFKEFPELQALRESMNNKKDTCIIMRVSKRQKAAWQEEAEARGMSLSAFIAVVIESYTR